MIELSPEELFLIKKASYHYTKKFRIPQEQEDIFQTVCIFLSKKGFDTAINKQAYIYKSVSNLCHDFINKRAERHVRNLITIKLEQEDITIVDSLESKPWEDDLLDRIIIGEELAKLAPHELKIIEDYINLDVKISNTSLKNKFYKLRSKIRENCKLL